MSSKNVSGLLAQYKRACKWIIQQPSPLVLSVIPGQANSTVWIGCPIDRVIEREEFLDFLSWCGVAPSTLKDDVIMYTIRQHLCIELAPHLEQRIKEFSENTTTANIISGTEELQRWITFASCMGWYETKSLHSMQVALLEMGRQEVCLGSIESIVAKNSDGTLQNMLGKSNFFHAGHLLGGYLLWRDFPLYFLGVARRCMSVYEDLLCVRSGPLGGCVEWLYHLGARSFSHLFLKNLHSAIVTYDRVLRKKGCTLESECLTQESIATVPLRRKDGKKYTKKSAACIRSSLSTLLKAYQAWRSISCRPTPETMHQQIVLKQTEQAMVRLFHAGGLSLDEQRLVCSRLTQTLEL
jgi:hypothetical protein